MSDTETESKVCGCGEPSAGSDDGKEYLCPFQLEVRGVHHICECCDSCRYECRQRI